MQLEAKQAKNPRIKQKLKKNKDKQLNVLFLFLFQACAPRYVYYIFMDRMDPVGMCFSARNNFTQIRPHRPCVESGSYLFSIFYHFYFLLNEFFSFFLSHPPPRHGPPIAPSRTFMALNLVNNLGEEYMFIVHFMYVKPMTSIKALP